LVAACGSGGGTKKVSSGSVAVVGDKSISKADWDALMAQTRRNFAATKRPFPKAGTVALANLKTNATQFLIQSSEYAQEADKLGLKISDQDVNARLAQIKKQYYGNPTGQPTASTSEMEKRYQAALKQQGFTDEEVRSGIKLQLIREKVFQKVTSDAKVSDNDVQAYYDKHKTQYETPAQPESRDVRHILVKTKALADSIYQQLQANPGKFAQLAKKYSTDTSSKVAGGKLPGGAIKGRTVPPFDKAAFSLKTNEISKPVHSQFGWRVIRMVKKDVQSFDSVKQDLLRTGSTTVFNDWMREQITADGVDVNPKYGRFDPTTLTVLRISSTATGISSTPSASPSA
jgi:Parvulin-like peptidyl-prolyl isomerase